jgi:CubicO group peptidase (beta-lactamase class C family)
LSTAELEAAAAGANRQMGGRTCYLVVKNGKIVHETYYGSTQPSSIRAGFSTTKSMCASLFGIAKQQGWANTADKIAPTGSRQCNSDADFSKVLTMTGQSSNLDNPRFRYDAVGTACLDTLNDFIGAKNPEGLSTEAFKNKYWHDVLGLEHTQWRSGFFSSGLQCGYTAETSCRDLARMGQLWANDGEWAGAGQVMNKEFVQQGREWKYSGSGTEYGYTTWLDVNDPVDPKIARFDGMYAQCAFHSREHNAVVVSMGNGNSCVPAWTNGRSAIVSNDHPLYASTRNLNRTLDSDIKNANQQEAIIMSSTLSLRDGIIKNHRAFTYADLIQYNERLEQVGGKSIFRRGEVNATNVYEMIVAA